MSRLPGAVISSATSWARRGASSTPAPVGGRCHQEGWLAGAADQRQVIEGVGAKPRTGVQECGRAQGRVQQRGRVRGEHGDLVQGRGLDEVGVQGQPVGAAEIHGAVHARDLPPPISRGYLAATGVRRSASMRE
ncbi:hypothetical protein ACFU9X_35880 [Streptomyces atratus]|uniref:hypothetical protein n=1 Tax=Streptomyces atratus TaxID=1893 RepID=UPI00367D3314